MRLIRVSPFDDKNTEYSIDELVEMYIAEGKSREEALELAKPLQRFLHSDNMRQVRSWYRSHWERTREEKIKEEE